MKLAILENHQTLPVKVYGGIERISLFHFMGQCALKEIEVVLICLAGSTVSDPYGEVKMITGEEMKNLLSGKLPLRDVVSDCDILLTNNSCEMFPVDLSGTNTTRINVCHGDWGEKTNNKYQFFLTRGQLASHSRKPGFAANHEHIFLVANGICPDWYSIADGPKNEIVWFSAVDNRKSPKYVGQIAKALDRRILTAGTGNPDHFGGGGNIKHLGKIDNEKDKCVLFAQAEVYIHTAHYPTFNDPCPTTVLEAQMCGVPVVGLISGGVKEIVYDPSLIFETLEEMVQSLQRKEYLRHRPQDVRDWAVENHSHIAMARRYNAQFEKLKEILAKG